MRVNETTSVMSRRGATIIMMVSLAMSGVAGCSGDEHISAPETVPFPSQLLEIGEITATVDVAAGTLTFEPVAPHSALAGAGVISAAIYGNQGVTVRIFNSPVVTSPSSTPGKKTFTASVGIRNLLPYQIGDEQSGSAPADTMGFDIFMGAGPNVTSTSSPCSPACTVIVKNADGSRAFSAPAQRYWHYPELLGPAGSATDTTRARKVWTFEADTQVTNFSFSVVVNAPWPAPYETRWKIAYEADSVPTSAASSRWREIIGGTGGTIATGSPAAGLMTLTTERKGIRAFARYDSLAAGTSAYMEVRVRRNDTGGKPEEVVFGMADDSKFIGVGLTSSRVGFLNDKYQFAISWAVDAATLRSYQLRKFRSDSVQILVDGARIGSRSYGSFPAVPAGAAGSAFFFGGPGVIFPAPNGAIADQSTTWDYVTYEIGVPTP